MVGSRECDFLILISPEVMSIESVVPIHYIDNYICMSPTTDRVDRIIWGGGFFFFCSYPEATYIFTRISHRNPIMFILFAYKEEMVLRIYTRARLIGVYIGIYSIYPSSLYGRYKYSEKLRFMYFVVFVL